MADDIQQMLESKRQLLLAISHELRSPLTRTKLLVEMLEGEKQREELNREINEMQQLIEELLETERLSSRHRILNREEMPLVTLTRNLVSESFPQSHIDLSLPGQELTCLLDPVRIKLLFKNLIGNALQHSGNHSSPPQVELKQEAGVISFRVKDFGQGIDEEHLPFLTEPFYRVDPARQHQTGSYGLGLYLCRMIAEAHGGSLELSSRKGMGSEVSVRLPCK
jgi:signal transduction histidine kinase